MSARDLAAKAQPGSVVRWDRIERAAYAGHPTALEALNADRAARPAKPKWKTLATIPVGLVMLFFMLTPILGVAAISRNRFQNYTTPAEETIPLAGTLYVLALVWLVGWMVVWFTGSRRYSSLPATFAGMTLVLGALSALAVADRGQEESVAGWELWMIPIVGSIIVSVVFIVVLIAAKIRGGGAGAAAESSDDVPQNQLQLLEFRRSVVAQLPEQDRLAITHDLESAIGDLERRGVISASESQRAVSASLGGLALRMGSAKATSASR